MAGSVNKVILIGNVGRDPEVRRTNSGSSIVNFSVATTESWRDKATGERKDKTEWHNIVVYNEQIAKLAEQYVKKGSKIYIEGQLQTREFTDRDGNQRKATEVVIPNFRGTLTLLDSPDSGNRGSGGASSGRGYGGGPTRTGGHSAGRMNDIIDDDIPFAPCFA